MNRKAVPMIICWAMAALVGTAVAQQQAPVAGSQTVAIGIQVEELKVIANGWSAKKQILGKEVYNEKNEKVGKVSDLIIAPDRAISYGIIGAGGFLGVDRHDVAIPVNQFKMKEGKIILEGATKEAIKGMPKFQYGK